MTSPSHNLKVVSSNLAPATNKKQTSNPMVLLFQKTLQASLQLSLTGRKLSQ